MGDTLAIGALLREEAGMPWQTSTMNDVRREFVMKVLQNSASLAALCREYGISRKTGYKWKQRALADGLSGVLERSRRPRRCPTRLEEETICALIALKVGHPSWGPKKLCEVYRRKHGSGPSIASCNRVLARAGLVRRRRRHLKQPDQRLIATLVPTGPNDIWTVDFKGWWRLGDGVRCEPLTVRDAYSRYVLAIALLQRANTEAVRAEFERLFQLYGLPKVIRSDNGSPFAARNAPHGLSRLSAWWVSLGIHLDRSRPGHPQDNGAHERLHRDMEAELASHLQPDVQMQQAAFDVWRTEFNHVRPHEALRGKCPAQLYQKSTRAFASAAPLTYGPGMSVRKVSRLGFLKWHSEQFFVSHALVGLDLGLKLTSRDELEVWLGHLHLGAIDLQTNRFRSSPSPAPEPIRLSA